MVLEHAQMLAMLLRERKPDLEKAFLHFEWDLRPSADHFTAMGRRTAQRKENISPFQYCPQQLKIRTFVPLFVNREPDYLLVYRLE